MVRKTVLTIILSLALVFYLQAQVVPKGSLESAKSNVEAEMQKEKEKNPKISTEKLAQFGNTLLAVKGYDFTFAADDRVNLGTKDVESQEFEVYKFKRTNGSDIKFATSEHGSHPCGTWTSLALTSINEKQITIVANQKLYQVLFPKKFYFDEMEVVGKNLRTKIRKWITPMDSMPEAISKDGKTIYVTTGFDDIFLGVSSEGKLQFVSAKNPNLIKQNTDIKKFPKDKNNDYLGYKRFGKGEQSFIIKFSYPCT